MPTRPRRCSPLGAQLDDVCGEMASVLELDAAPDAGLDRCPAVARHIERVSATYLSPSEVLVLSEAPSRCDLSVESAGACATACGLDGGSITCDGAPTGPCDGHCNGTCDGDCGAGCVGGCAGFCAGTCDGDCAGQCDGTCAVIDGLGGCLGACDGRCEGVCSGTCAGTCDEIESREAICVGGCDGACDGTCIGTCTGDWAPRCAGPLSAPDGDPCGLACVLTAGLDATCTTPNVRLRGPELADADAHVVMDRTVIALLVHGGALRRIEADVALRLWALPQLAEAVRAASAESRVVDCGPPLHAALAEALGAYERVEADLAELLQAPRTSALRD